MTPCRFFSSSKPTTSCTWVSSPTSGESSEARSARPVRVGAWTSWPAASKKGTTFCQHQPPCHAPCTSTNVAMLASSRGQERDPVLGLHFFCGERLRSFAGPVLLHEIPNAQCQLPGRLEKRCSHRRQGGGPVNCRRSF